MSGDSRVVPEVHVHDDGAPSSAPKGCGVSYYAAGDGTGESASGQGGQAGRHRTGQAQANEEDECRGRRQSWGAWSGPSWQDSSWWSTAGWSSQDWWHRWQDPWSRTTSWTPENSSTGSGGGSRRDEQEGHNEGGGDQDDVLHPDPWADGRDRGPRRAPRADGRDRAHAHDGAWDGWKHFSPTCDEQKTPDDGIGGVMAWKGGPRPSEKLSVPGFDGDESEDIGSSARSYLRQVEAWRRMTLLPPRQQALVLYQHLSGRAWVAAEELDMDRLGQDNGVSYFVKWVSDRYLDLEITKIGKAFSEFFRRLRRKPGQSIRDYNSEYDRLYARLREVGCALPEDCAAWLYVDRLQLEEAAELNLLASVGNVYSLGKLQKAAIIQDRGHRKPWENGKTKRAHVAHMTDHDDVQATENEEGDSEEDLPEEVALAYVTYQNAKNRYKEQSKSRGYVGNDDHKKTKDAERDERVRQMKLKSFCSGCGRKGHWHRDAECPKNKGAAAPGATRETVKEVGVCYHVPAEVYTLRHEGTLVGITDTACAKTVTGTGWLQQYTDMLPEGMPKPTLIRECEAFRFGTGKVHYSAFAVNLHFALGNSVVTLRASVINGDVPLLLSKQVLASLGMVYDVAANRASFCKIGIKDFDLRTTSSGHPAIPIVPTKAGSEMQELHLDDSGAPVSEQYMAFVLSEVNGSGRVGSSSYHIFYDKKLSPEVKNLLTQDKLCEVSFMAWWSRSGLSSDFWLEAEHSWVRVHVTPRRSLFNPGAWKTSHTVQKDMLLNMIGEFRVTEGICCRTNKPLESVADLWSPMSLHEPTFPLLWVGRSVFAKRASIATPPLRAAVPDGASMPRPCDQQDVEDRVVVGSHEGRPGGPSKLEHGGDQGVHHGASLGTRRLERGGGNESDHPAELPRAESQSDIPGNQLSGEDHEREPAAPGEGLAQHSGQRPHDHRQVPGVRVPRDPRSVCRMGQQGSQSEQGSTRGVGEVRSMVGPEAAEEELHHDRAPGGEQCGALPGGELDIEGNIQCGRVVVPGRGGQVSPSRKRANSDEATTTGQDNEHAGGQQGGGPARRDTGFGGEADSAQGESGLPKDGGQSSVDGEGSLGRDVPAQPSREKKSGGNINDICCGQIPRTPPVFENFITEGDFVKGAHAQHLCYSTQGAADPKFDTGAIAGEQAARKAIAENDFSHDSCLRVLRAANLVATRNTRGPMLGNKADKVDYHSFGLYTHGGMQGITRDTKDRQALVRFLNMYAKAHLPQGATWTSVAVTLNCKTGLHSDFNNLRDSQNYTVSLGDGNGGRLWLEDKKIEELEANSGKVEWKQNASGHWIPGRSLNTFQNFTTFDPFLKHMTGDWEGERWCLTFHTTRGIQKVGSELKRYLKNCGYPLPRLPNSQVRQADGQDEGPKRPQKSMRKQIFKNAAKLSVLMMSLVAAATSYTCECAGATIPRGVDSPIVLFEIGSTSASEEVTSLGKDVYEPMSWEAYKTVDGKETAFHIVNGGFPRELRLELDGKGAGDDHALAELSALQIRSGGTVVVVGRPDDGFWKNEVYLHDCAECLQYTHVDEGNEVETKVFFKSSNLRKQMPGQDRVHGVCVVEAPEGGVQDKPSRLDGTGITFSEDTPPMIASALRRLHQNLGHPRRVDLLRHLRLAGCEVPVLKALKTMKCETCEANAMPKSARPSSLPHMYDFGDVIGIDVFYAHDCSDVRHTFISIVDYGTTFHIVGKLGGQTGGEVEEAINSLWIGPYGAPKCIVADLEGGLQTGISRLCDWHNIEVKPVAAQGHWQAGMVERQGAWWKAIWDRVIHEMSVDEESEVTLVVPLINAAKNDLRRRHGHSPSQWVFGRGPRVPEDLLDPDNGERVSWDLSGEARFQRQAALRASARVAFHKSQTDDRLRRALLQRARTTSRPLETGESVHFWHRRKDRKRGEWKGPGVIVGKQGCNYWISFGGRCRLTAPEHVRPASPEEIGELFVMKGVQREVERLLQEDFDNPEVFEADDEESGDQALDDELADYEPDLDDEINEQQGDIALEHMSDDVIPVRRLKRKTPASELSSRPPRDVPVPHQAMMLKSDLTRRGVEKRKEKELKWAEIPEHKREEFRSAEKKQWLEHLEYDALQPLDAQQSREVIERVGAKRILRSRWAYKDKNWAKRLQEEQSNGGTSETPWKCKARLVIAGHTDPDLGVEQLSTDAPTLSRAGLACMMQRAANGMGGEDPWCLSAGDIRCAFLTGSYLNRELYIHQPRTGFPDMSPGDLVRVKKNVFGLATSPHEWWGDLQNGIKGITIDDLGGKNSGKSFGFDQCPLDPCIFMLRERDGDGGFRGEPIAYLGSHVDDLIIAAPRSCRDSLQQALSATFPIDSWENDSFEFLGSHLWKDAEGVHINQDKYASSRLFSLDIPSGLPGDTPATPELIADNRSLIGALSWLSAQSRPDLTCSVSMAQQLQSSPVIDDLKFTNSIANRAQQFKHEGLHFRPIPEQRLMILNYHDAAWANTPPDDQEDGWFSLSPSDNERGLQREGPFCDKDGGRKAKRNNSKVASQLGCLVLFADRGVLSGEPGKYSVADWRSKAGQRVCRSTFGAETQACVEGLETAEYIRSMYETLRSGSLVSVVDAIIPILCLSDCRSLFDHLTKQGVPRVPSDKRLAVDLAALRQSLKEEQWSKDLPIGWIPNTIQLSDILTKPQNPTAWWERMSQDLLVPISLAQKGVLINNKQGRPGTSVKLEVYCSRSIPGSCFHFEYEVM